MLAGGACREDSGASSATEIEITSGGFITPESCG